MPAISVTADFAQVQTASNSLVAQLQAIDDRVAKVTSTIAQFNSIGNQVGATVRGITRDGKEFTATLGIIDKFEKQVAASIAGANVSLNVQKLAFRDVQKEMEKTKSVGDVLLGQFGKLAGQLRTFGTFRAFNAITNELQDGVKAANEFQIRLSLIRTLSQENQQTSGQFGQQVRRVSDQTGFNIQDVGRSFYDAISNQVAKGPQVEAFARTIADLARVTGSDLTDAGNTVTATLNAYNLSASEAEKVSAVLFRVVDEGRIVLSETANTLGRVQVIAANLGVTFQEVGAILAVTTQKGFKTADAMTLLTNLLIKLEKPTQATAGFFTSLGVDSGEAAVKLFGTFGLLRKIVEEVRSGRTDVSAFFDEIRGRKQFAVFEQSIDQIERFGESLSNTAANVAVYREAINIRGESSADFLNREANALSNIFKVDIGTRILDTTAALVKYAQSVRDVVKESSTLSTVVDLAGKGLLIYAGYAVIARVGNYALATSFVAVGNSLVSVSKRLAVIAAIAAAYAFVKDISDRIIASRSSGTRDLEFDPEVFARSAARLNDLRRQEAEASRRGPDNAPPPDSLESTGNRVQAAYRQVLGILAQVQLANNQTLDDAKKKAAEVAEATKAAFAAYSDRVKEGINAIKRAITESRNEIDKSAKSLERLRTTNDDIIFGVQQRYATAEQKIALNKQRIQDLITRAGTLLTPGATSDQREEGRRLFAEARRLTAENFEAEQDLAIGRNRANGGTSTTVFLTELRRQLAELTEREAAAERDIQATERQRIANNTALQQAEGVRLDRLQAALKNLQDLTPFTAQGAIRPEFQTGGQFDRAKFEAEEERRRAAVRAVAGGSADQRFQLEIEFARFRQSLIREAAAVERAEIVRTTQARITADEEALQKKINDEKKAREDAINAQTRSFQSLQDSGGQLRGFASVVREDSRSRGAFGEPLQLITPEKTRALEVLNSRIQQYEGLVRRLNDNAENVDGRRVFRTEDIEAAQAAYGRVITQFIEIQRLNGRQGQSPAVNGADLNQTSELVQRELAGLTRAATAFGDSLLRQNGFEEQLRTQVQQPLATLRQSFPDLAAASDAAFARVAARATETTNQAIQPLLNKVRELREELERLNQGAGGPRAALEGAIGGEAYAANGGVAGLFPGQPRGQDRYPIWAAKDEFIVNAQSSRMFRPMLEAINNRRAPRYMAQGGVVGGDTNVGDINVTVNGGETNADTGRVISQKLAREFRRGNITRGNRR